MSINISDTVTNDCTVSGHSLPRALRATYISLDFILTLFGNILTIIITRKVEEFSDSTKILITSLALADLGVALVVATSLIAEISGQWIFPDWTCVASFILFYIFTAVSIYMVILMTFDRLVAVVRPLRYSLIFTKRRCSIAVTFVWFGSTLGAIATTITNRIIYNECSALCTTAGRNILQSIVSVVTFYFIPLVLILLMNIKLLSVARQHAKRSRNQVGALPSALNVPSQQLPSLRGIRGKAVGVITLVTFAFILSWSFFYVKLIHRTMSDGVFPEGVEFATIWLALTNSWWNVIIYSVMNRSFRRHMVSVLRRLVLWCPVRLRQPHLR